MVVERAVGTVVVPEVVVVAVGQAVAQPCPRAGPVARPDASSTVARRRRGSAWGRENEPPAILFAAGG